LPDIKPIELKETDKDTYKTGTGSMILLTIGAALSLASMFLIIYATGNYAGDYMWKSFLLLLLYGVMAIVGFILFAIAWFKYAKKKMHILSSFGWWILLNAAWFEVFFINTWISWLQCYDNGQGLKWCEHVTNAIPYCLVPVIFILLGLALIYTGKKQKNQNL
jgi:hypothetical protein